MSQLDAMLGGLASEGKLEAAGEFQLDAKQAREKMQKFQLEDPHFYVLELVQAAHLLGARELAFRIDSDEMELHFDGEALEREELEQLYSAAFARRTTARVRALRHIAIATNAARALDPRFVRIEVAAREPGEPGLALELREGEEDRFEQPVLNFPGRTRIYLRESFRTSHIADFFHNLRGDNAEKTALKERCKYARMKITLDGEVISSGQRLPQQVLGELAFEREHERGLLGFTFTQEPSLICITQNDVLITEHHAPSAMVQTFAVVDSDQLTKNLSQSAFVEDAAWHALFERLRLDMHASIAQYFSSAMRPSADGLYTQNAPPVGSMLILKQLALEQLERHKRGLEIPAVTRRLCQEMERLRVLKLALPLSYQGVIWETLSLAQLRLLLTASSKEIIPTSLRRFDELDASTLPYPVMWEDSEDNLEWLEQWMGMPRESEQLILQRALTRRRNQARWEASPVMGQRFPPEYTLRVPFESGTLKGEWAIAPRIFKNARVSSTTAPGQLLYIKSGRLLAAHDLGGSLLKGMMLSIEGELGANELFTSAAKTPELMRAHLEATRALEQALKLLASSLSSTSLPESLRLYFFELLSSACEGKLSGMVLDALDVHHRAHAQLHEVWKLGVQASESASLFGLSTKLSARPDEKLAELGSLAELELFTDLDRRPATLRDLFLQIKTAGKLALLGQEYTPALEEEWKISGLEETLRIFLVLRNEERVLLSQLVGTRYLRYMGDVIRRHAVRARFMQRAVVELALPTSTPYVATQPLNMRHDKGVIGLMDASALDPEERPVIRLTILHRQRVLEVTTLSVSLGQLSVVLDTTSLEPNASWESVLRNKAWTTLTEQLKQLALKMVVEHTEALLAKTVAERSSAQLALLLQSLWQLRVKQFSGNPYEEVQSLRMRLERTALFEELEGEAVSLLGLRERVDARERLHVVYDDHPPIKGLAPPTAKIVRMPGEHAVQAWLHRVLADIKNLKLVDVSQTAQARQELERARAQFFMQDVLPETVPLPEQDILARAPIKAQGITGEVGLAYDRMPEKSIPGVRVEILHEGRRIHTISKMLFLGRFAARASMENLEVRPDYSTASSVSQLNRLRRAVGDESLELLGRWLNHAIERGAFASARDAHMVMTWLVKELAAPPREDYTERKIVQLLHAAPIFALFPNDGARTLAVGAAGTHTSMERLRQELGRVFLWITSTWARARIPVDFQAPMISVEQLRAQQEEQERLERRAQRAASFSGTPRPVSTPASPSAYVPAKQAPPAPALALKKPAPRPVSLPAASQAAGPVTQPAAASQPVVERDEVQELVARVIQKLKQVRRRRTELLGDAIFMNLQLVERLPDDRAALVRHGALSISRTHRAMRHALERPRDPVALMLLGSALYSEINRYYEEITDGHEREFQRLLSCALLDGNL